MSPDLDDTVAHPPRHAHVERASELIHDVEDTITWTRPVTAPIDVTSPAAEAPPAPLPPPPPALGTAIPDVSDNIWSEPLPNKPLPFRIRLDDGTLVPLDQPVYLGRRPSVPRIHPGGIPLLVTFDSPQREVSSTHLELTTVGGAIVATDLKSTNGSIVRVPGAAPHTLLGGESAVLTPGTRIELGDGNSIELLAPGHPDAAESQPTDQ